jgi:RHS repeat-associated protein
MRTREAMLAGGADAPVRWDSCRLDFFGTFLIKQKSTEENNMNGRLYDPVIARFFSPDKYVANSSFTQDFNRYTYARNNPLMYTDPDGEFIQYIFGAIMGGISGWQIGKAAGAKGWAMFGYIMGGAGIGAITAGIGTAITTTVGTSLTAAGASCAGWVGAMAGSTVSGAISGAAFTRLAGGNPLDGMWKGALSGLAGGLTSSVIGGGAGAFAGGFTSSATGAILNGAKGGDILKSELIGGALSWGSYEIQMRLSYRQYNRSAKKPFGNDVDLKYSGFRKISVASQRSFAWGVEAGGWILNDGTVGKIAYGGKDWVKMPPRPNNPIAEFHTHPQGAPYIQHHSIDDAYAATEHRDVSYVISQRNIYRYDAAQWPFLYSGNDAYLQSTLSMFIDTDRNGLELYPFFWLRIR